MNNNKKRKAWKFVLCIALTVVLIISTNMILWAVGIIGTHVGFIIFNILYAIVIASIEIIIWNIGISK